MLGNHFSQQTIRVSFLDTRPLDKKFKLCRAEFNLDGLAIRIAPCQLKVAVVGKKQTGLYCGREFK